MIAFYGILKSFAPETSTRTMPYGRSTTLPGGRSAPIPRLDCAPIDHKLVDDGNDGGDEEEMDDRVGHMKYDEANNPEHNQDRRKRPHDTAHSTLLHDHVLYHNLCRRSNYRAPLPWQSSLPMLNSGTLRRQSHRTGAAHRGFSWYRRSGNANRATRSWYRPCSSCSTARHQRDHDHASNSTAEHDKQ